MNLIKSRHGNRAWVPLLPAVIQVSVHRGINVYAQVLVNYVHSSPQWGAWTRMTSRHRRNNRRPTEQSGYEIAIRLVFFFVLRSVKYMVEGNKSLISRQGLISSSSFQLHDIHPSLSSCLLSNPHSQVSPSRRFHSIGSHTAQEIQVPQA